MIQSQKSLQQASTYSNLTICGDAYKQPSTRIVSSSCCIAVAIFLVAVCRSGLQAPLFCSVLLMSKVLYSAVFFICWGWTARPRLRASPGSVCASEHVHDCVVLCTWSQLWAVQQTFVRLSAATLVQQLCSLLVYCSTTR